MTIQTTFSRHFLKRLPVIVREDVNSKLKARKERANATKDNLEKALNDAVKNGLKAAPYIEDKYSFVDCRRRANNERLTHFILVNDEAMKKLSANIADENLLMLNSINPDEFASFLDAMEHVCRAMSKNLRTVHINPPISFPKSYYKLTAAEKESYLTVGALKMQSEEWLLKRLKYLRSQYIEFSQIALGRVGRRDNQQRYISPRSFSAWMKNQKEAQKFIQNTSVYCEETGENFALEEVVKRTTANPENRRIEMMVRSRGFEELAQELGYTALFITWTLPSKYHRESDKWGGFSPKDGHKELMHKWQKARAIIAKAAIDYFGFRVAEPHKDGTSHGHYFLFVSHERKDELANIIRAVAISEDEYELGDDISPRFKLIEADPEQGGATAYIAKYVSKNINGAHMPESKAEESAFFVRAWASTHKIRQFQQFGGEPVSLWRQLRRADESQTKHDAKLEELRQAADSSKWSLFCKLAGDAKIEYEEKQNQYGEVTKKIIGFSWLSDVIETAVTKYRLVSKVELDGLLKRRGAPSWSTENNCNSGLKAALEELTGWSSGGVECLIKPLLMGNGVPIDKWQSVKLKNNRLITY